MAVVAQRLVQRLVKPLMGVQFPSIAPLVLSNERNMTLRSYLNQSALLLEGVENVTQNSIVNVYYGFNVSKTDQEPLDQIQGFIAAKRIQEWNQKQFGEAGVFIPFIGGLFEVLNCNDDEQLKALVETNTPKELSKQKLFKAISTLYGLESIVPITKDLWQDQRYWEILKSLFDKQIFTRGLLINNTLKFYDTKDQLMSAMKVKELPSDLVNLPLEFVKKIGNFPAPILYTPAEVTEAFYLAEKYGVTTKLGQAQERVYDQYLYQDMSVYRLRQPVSLDSTKLKVKTVTPYIAKATNTSSGSVKQDVRIYFTDTFEQVKEKVEASPIEEYAFSMDEKYGEVLNPIIEKTIFAVESARILGKTPITIGGCELSEGSDVIDAVLEKQLSITALRDELPQLLFENIIKPVGALL